MSQIVQPLRTGYQADLAEEYGKATKTDVILGEPEPEAQAAGFNFVAVSTETEYPLAVQAGLAGIARARPYDELEERTQ